MAFNESRLLDCVAYGSEFGHQYSTRITSLKSGHERRNANWSAPLGKYAVIYQNLLPEDHAAVIEAHHACMGQLIGFRFKDWTDFSADREDLSVGTGANQIVQLKKTYPFGSIELERNITKPVQNTLHFYANDTEIWPIASDYTTGIFTVNATAGATISWSGQFDVPVRFSSDEISFQAIDRNRRRGLFLTADVELQEIRL